MSRDFSSAAQAILEFLHARMGFRQWMVTRTEGEDWIVLAAKGDSYDIGPGKVFEWSDSFCSRMVQDLGPRIAPRADEIPAYAIAPIREKVEIGAYIGVPLTRHDGSLFGTLCAIDPAPQDKQVVEEQALVELLADLLSGLLQAELAMTDAIRRAERAETEAAHDPLTQLYNRRGWDYLIEREESRCRRYGHPACVVYVDLDDMKQVNDTQGHAAGDLYLQRAAAVLLESVRSSDVVARLGGDEFAILGAESDAAACATLIAHVRKKLHEAGIAASLGGSTRTAGRNLEQACRDADAAMYRAKKRPALAGRTGDAP